MYFRIFRPLLIFLFIFSSSLLFKSGAWASEKFSTNYNITYNIAENGATQILLKISLQNKTPDYYASSYKINVGIADIENVTARDPDGEIKPTVIKGDNESTIELNFNKRVVGLSNTLLFEISFSSQNIAKRIGKILEINIPGMSKASDVSSFNVSVIVPASFGEPAYVKPNVLKGEDAGGGKILYQSTEGLGDSGIYMAFGEYQIFAFDIKYHIRNKNLYPVTTEIALPPNTNYQEVSIENINPRPRNVRIDKDGNWLAEYALLPTQKQDILVSGKAKISLTPKQEVLNSTQLAGMLTQKPYWQVNDPQIKRLAGLLKTPESIYEYVVSSLNYDFGRVTREEKRLGAGEVLKNPSSAVCTEFTDLFIAITRAAGIPAREINGFAYTQNATERPLSLVKDILHAWPEYYDREKQTWIMVDPTWGNTTGGLNYFNVMDFDHFTFVRKGLNSTFPVPPGGDKDIDITFAEDFSPEEKSPQLEVSFFQPVFPWNPVKGQITIENTGTTLLKGSSVNVSRRGREEGNQKLSFTDIPPYGKETLPINLGKSSLIQRDNDIIVMSFQGKNYSKAVPGINNKLLAVGALASIGGVVLIGAFVWKISRKFRNIPLQK